jgi:hypothetical protein
VAFFAVSPPEVPPWDIAHIIEEGVQRSPCRRPYVDDVAVKGTLTSLNGLGPSVVFPSVNIGRVVPPSEAGSGDAGCNLRIW